MKRLILITDHYPYTRGELPFVQPELAVTCQHFEVSVICKSPAEKQEYPLPPGVKLYHYHKDATMGEKIRNLFGCLLDGNYYRSVFGKEHAKGSWRAREAEVRNFRLSAHLFRKYLRDEGFFDRIEHTIYYSYWYNYGAMALALEKQRHPRMRIITCLLYTSLPRRERRRWSPRTRSTTSFSMRRIWGSHWWTQAISLRRTWWLRR